MFTIAICYLLGVVISGIGWWNTTREISITFSLVMGVWAGLGLFTIYLGIKGALESGWYWA